MTTILIAIAIFGLVMLVMAVGVIFSGRCLRGSCGGSEEVIGPDGEPIRCSTCPKRKEEEDARRAALEAARHEDDEEEDDRLITPVATSRFDRDRR